MARSGSVFAQADTLSYSYNSFGELVSYKDGNGSTTKFEYDSAGRVTKRIWADGSTVTYTYDSLGRLSSKSEAGRNTSFSYDSFGRLIGEKIVFAKDEYSRKMSYDELGRLASVSDASGIVTFEYDKFGRKIAEKGVVGEFRMSYDSKGRLASVETRLKGSKESFVTEYTYDEFDRIVRVKSPSGEFNYTWTQDGKLVSQSIDNSKVVNSYDKVGRLISKMLGDTVLASYEYDSLDRRIGGQYFDVKWRYSYDQFNQLTGAKSSTGDKFKYEYDAIGNRLKVESNGKMEAYAYNNLNQISSAGYAYDQWGNMVMTPDAQYAYDLKNRLVKVTKKDGTIIDYAYDAMDQRISSSVSGKKTEFLMSGMVEYARNEGNTALYHTLGLDLAGSLYRTGAVGAVLASGDMSYLYDGNGNVIGVMQDGKITHKLAYEPFGKQTTNVNLPFTFSTKSVDSSDMSYYGYRFYSASNSRWINRDPMKESGGMNSYSIVHNSPVGMFDVLGLWATGDHETFTRQALRALLPSSTDTTENKFRNYIIDRVVAENGNTDTNSSTKNNLGYHFNRPLDAAGAIPATIANNIANAKAAYATVLSTLINDFNSEMSGTTAAKCKTALTYLGQLSHAWQDYYGHGIRLNSDGRVPGTILGSPHSPNQDIKPASWGGITSPGEHTPSIFSSWEPGDRATDAAVRRGLSEGYVRMHLSSMVATWITSCKCLVIKDI